MTPLKIKITVRDRALEMQVLERNWSGKWSNGDMRLVSNGCYSACLGASTVRVGSSVNDLVHFHTNSGRDAYLARVKKLMSDFHRAWKAGEVEVLR